MPIIELLYILKSRAEGVAVSISQGLLDRVAAGPTLKSWVRKIDEKFMCTPGVSEFELGSERREEATVMREFI
jgi:hypothetical protein